MKSNFNNHSRILNGANGARILCVADVRGALSSLNQLAHEQQATHILHTGDFGFYDATSHERMTDKTLRHVVQYSPLISPASRASTFITHPTHDVATLRKAVKESEVAVLSELQEFLDGKKTLNVPLYTVWGACEDVSVLEKFRSGEYKVNHLNVVDEASSRLLNVGGLSLRLLGLGGAVVLHKLFDNGEGKSTIAGGQGTMWTTVLQIGELLTTAERTFSTNETRILMTHHSPGREGLLSQLAHAVKADFTVSAGLHFRYGSSYNEFSISPSASHFSQKLSQSRAAFMSIYEVVKPELTNLLNTHQTQLLSSVLAMVESMPKDSSEVSSNTETLLKNMWNFNLPDSQFGTLVLDIKEGRIQQEMKSQGFNFAFRKGDKIGTRPAAKMVSSATSTPPAENQADKQHGTLERSSKAPKPVKTPTSTSNGDSTIMPQPAQGVSGQVNAASAASTPAEDTVKSDSVAEQQNDKEKPGLWVSPCSTSDRAKELFPTSISTQIKATSAGRQYCYVFFENQDAANSALTEWEAREEKEGIMVKPMVQNSQRSLHYKNSSRTENDASKNFRGGRGIGRGSRGRGSRTQPR